MLDHTCTGVMSLSFSIECLLISITILQWLPQVIYEDLPANLCAIRDRVELGEQQSPQDLDYLAQLHKEIDMENSNKGDTVSQGDHSVTTSKPVKGACSKVKSAPLTQNLQSLSGGRRRPLVSGLQQDIKVLDRELLKFISEKVDFHHLVACSCCLLLGLSFVEACAMLWVGLMF